MGWAEAITGGLADLGGALLGQQGQRDTNVMNENIARQNREMQIYQSNTAYQRATDDLRAAGLNPILAVTGGAGGGASTPSGSTATMQNPEQYFQGIGSRFVENLNTAYTVDKMKGEISNLAKTGSNIDSGTALNEAGVADTLARAAKTNAEMGNVATSKLLMEAQADAARAAARLSGIQADSGIPKALVGRAAQAIADKTESFFKGDNIKNLEKNWSTPPGLRYDPSKEY